MASFVAVMLALAVMLPRAASAEERKDGDAAEATPPPERWEPGLVPIVGYDSDLGVALGAIGVLARFEPGYDPYRLRLQACFQLNVAVDDTGDASVPYHDDYVRVDAPGLLDDRLRLQAEIAFNKLATTGYYGIGQRTLERTFTEAEREASEVARRYYTYDKAGLLLDFFARFTPLKLETQGEAPRLEIYDGTHIGYFWLERYPGSKLVEDALARRLPTARGEVLRDLLHGTTDHPLIAKSIGVLWDDRNHEFAPDQGSLTELGARFSPGITESLTHTRVHFQTRWFAPIVPSWLVFAHRFAVDVLAGQPPVDEMSQLGVLQPEDLGGSTTLRGVPLRRFHGRIKVLGQVELRGSFPWFSVFGQRFQIGVVGFTDAAHVRADFASTPELDEDRTRPPFTLGTGGGLRIRWADTFILRADGGYSPTEETYGVYVDVGHAF